MLTNKYQVGQAMPGSSVCMVLSSWITLAILALMGKGKKELPTDYLYVCHFPCMAKYDYSEYYLGNRWLL